MAEADSRSATDRRIQAALDQVMAVVVEPPVVQLLESNTAVANCAETVTDYLDHNEATLALEHLIYVVGEADLPIDSATFATIASCAAALGVGPHQLSGIDPGQAPVESLDQLAAYTNDAHTIAGKRLPAGWARGFVRSEHRGPFPGTHVFEVAGESAEPFRALVGELEPTKRVKRCHKPRYSLVMWGPSRPVVEAALCFSCNNATTRIGGAVFGSLSFDGDTAAASDLLEWFRAHDDNDATNAQ